MQRVGIYLYLHILHRNVLFKHKYMCLILRIKLLRYKEIYLEIYYAQNHKRFPSCEVINQSAFTDHHLTRTKRSVLHYAYIETEFITFYSLINHPLYQISDFNLFSPLVRNCFINTQGLGRTAVAIIYISSLLQCLTLIHYDFIQEAASLCPKFALTLEDFWLINILLT